MSLTPKYKNKRELLQYAVGLLKKEEIFHEKKLNTIKSILKLEIDNLLDEDDKKDFEGGIEMTDETEKIIKQVIDEVNRKYEQEAIYEAEQNGIKQGKEEGKKEGRKETQEEIAKKLKGLLTPEQISKITGLSLNTILLL